MSSTVHNCADKGCKGLKFNGLNLTCNYCLMPCFFDCIEDEIGSLLSLLNIDLDNIDGVSKYDKIKDISTNIKSLFYESLFVFVCPLCKQKDSYFDLNLKLITKNDSIKLLKSENKKHLKEIENINASLKAETENVLHLTAQLATTTSNASKSTVISNSTESSDSLHIANLNSRLKIVEDFLSHFPKLDSINSNDIQSISSIPVVQANNEAIKVHEIYISKFPPQTSCEDIIKLITEQLLLNSGVFNVVKLVRRNLNLKKLSFVSFKISTMNKQVFDSIINSDIWSPDYSAVKFISKTKPKSGANKQIMKPINKKDNIKNQAKIISKVNIKNKNKNKTNNIIKTKSTMDTNIQNYNKNKSNKNTNYCNSNSIFPNHFDNINSMYQNFQQMKNYHQPPILRPTYIHPNYLMQQQHPLIQQFPQINPMQISNSIY